MQDKKDLKTNIQPRGRGWKVRWVPCVGKDLLEAMHNFRGKMKGKRKYVVKLR
jgi:hypothetical protein